MKRPFSKGFLFGLIFSILFIGAIPGFGQNTPLQISINLKSVRLSEALNEINRKANNQVLFKVEEVSKAQKLITLTLKNATVQKCVTACLEGTEFYSSLQGDLIIVQPRKDVEQQPKPAKHFLRGTVRDIAGLPLEGVAVQVKGTLKGMATDANGFYELDIPKYCVVVYSCVGKMPREVRIRGQEEQDIILEDFASEVNEVVVTGMFNKSKGSYTGSISTITANQIQAAKGQNLIQTLKNIDPSLNVRLDNTIGSNPNALPQFTLRGNSSLPTSVSEYNTGLKNTVNTPLIIMDGFEITLTKLMDYNDEDIESINVLKDASATAIYGSRGANGVIVIISKQPQPGKLRINAQAGVTLEMPDLTSYDLLNASELLGLQKRLGLYSSDIPYTMNKKQVAYEARLKDVLEGVDTDWLHYPVRTGISNKYNLRLEGGSDEFRWGTSLSYNNIEGAMKGSERNTFNGLINIAYTYKNVLFKNQLSIGQNHAIESRYGSFGTWAKMMPYDKPYDENGEIIAEFPGLYEGMARIGNPLKDATLNSLNDSKYVELINNFSIEWDIMKELKLRAQLGISKKLTESNNFLPANHSSFKDYTTDDKYFRRGSYTFGTGNNFKYDGEITLSYSKTFKGKHQVYAGLDYFIQNNDYYGYTFKIEGFPIDSPPFIGNALQYEHEGLPTGSKSTTRSLGVTGNMNYTYANRYYVDLSYRMDGSSQFGSKNRFAPFWSAGLGWNLHRENFLKNSEVIDLLRVKLSYGQTGSQNFSAYQALQTYQYYTGDKYLNRTGAYLIALGNDKLKWQTTNEFNIGTEIGIINNRVNATFDYYRKKTTNLLSAMDLPYSTGYPSYIENVGAVRNNGFETSLNWYVFRNTSKGGVIWLLGTKLAYNKNSIDKLSEAIKTQNEVYRNQDVDVSTLFYEGYAQNSIWAVRSLGIDPSTGKELFLDKNGDITETWHPSAKVYCGISDPLYNGNISSMLRYRNFTLNLTFGYHWGGQVYNQTLLDKVEVTTHTLYNQNVDHRVLSDRWSKPGDVTFFKAFSNNDTHATSRFVMDENVFELQSASLQYKIDEAQFLKKWNIQSMTFNLNMSDLFYLSSVKRERGTTYPFARRAGISIAVMF
ncbi:MAG: SusC/RagA family TonB-linked outer membrane protein [Rikenellaceae bacterium]|nr:SusC/RagA family TonB-linked outer membrane protein [Rikenellaceae bacterium]